MTPSKPYGLIRALREYDDQLRLRWGVHQAMWIVERRLPPNHPNLTTERPRTDRSPRWKDLAEGLNDGYVHVLNVHPTLADNTPLVMEHITSADSWRRGDMQRLADAWDAQDEAVDTAEDHERTNVHQTLARESYDRLAWLEGRRVAVTEPQRPERLEQREGYLVSDRRVTP